MKTTSKILATLLVSALPALAQKPEEPPLAGFIRVVAAVSPGSGNVKVLIDGSDVYPEGYKLGQVTGGIGLTPGGHTITIKREGVKEGVTKVSIEKDQTVTLIPFAEKIPATDQEPAHFEMRILRLKQKQRETGRSATFVSVSAQPEIKAELRDPEGKWEAVFVKRLTVAESTIKYPEGYVPIRANGVSLEPIPIGEAGNYAVILYDDPAGKICSLNFRDFKFLSAD
jgi:hypothetical protein